MLKFGNLFKIDNKIMNVYKTRKRNEIGTT